jgi:hypothetical protein
MSANEPVPQYDPSEDVGTGSPLVDALNRFASEFPVLHDPAEVQAFMKSVEGLPDMGERVEQFMQEIIARYEKWAKDNGVEWD